MNQFHLLIFPVPLFLRSFLARACLLLVLAGCEPGVPTLYSPTFTDGTASHIELAEHEYIFGVHPLHNPERLFEVFGPLVDTLNEQIPGVTFRLEASKNYAAYEEKLYHGKFDFALPNPYQTINALNHGYRVFGKMADDHKFRGLILVRKDSGITTVDDLKGKAVSFPAPTALAATMMPLHYLQTHGLDVMQDIEIRYVGSQESSIMNVYLGDVAAGATWPQPWHLLAAERPELEAELQVLWETDALVNNGLVVRDDVDPQLVEQVAAVLFTLQDQSQGRLILAAMNLSHFEPAVPETYAPVVEFLANYAATVRPQETHP
jgi:phosphonate transport system substrate-binding protein